MQVVKADFGAVVIGAGIVGISVARALATRIPTLLLEGLSAPASLTSSRNSGVVHAGFYYPPNSLKTRLCIRGAEMLKSLCETREIPFHKVGKIVVAQTRPEATFLFALHQHANALQIPTEIITRKRLNVLEPGICANEMALLSPNTAIVDTHALVMALIADLQERGGDLVLNTAVTRIRKKDSGSGWVLNVIANTGESASISADLVVNSAGLYSCQLANMTSSQNFTPYYCKGTYYSYSGPMRPKHLVYPCPEKDLGGLGIHLTLDTAGQLRFGPDVEWAWT